MAAAASVAALGLGASTAQAATAQASSTNVVSTIEVQGKIIRSSPAYRELQHFKITNAAQAKAAIPKFAALDVKLKTAASVVAKASTTSPQQKQGQTDWVKGVRDLSTGIAYLETGLKDAVAHKDAAGKAALLKATAPIKQANVLSAQADQLLGLPKAD